MDQPPTTLAYERETQSRVRLVTIAVNLVDDTDNPTFRRREVVSVRYGWDGPEPNHSCVADGCPTCIKRAVSKARARVEAQHAWNGKLETASVQVLRDRQAPAERKQASK